MNRFALTLIGLIAASAEFTPVARAQYTGVNYNRPSQGPSQTVGLVGGLGTRESVRQIDQRRPYGSTGGGPILGTFGLGRGADAGPPPLPDAVLPSRPLGRSFPWNRRQPFINAAGVYSTTDLQIISGLDLAQSLSMPLMGVDSPRIIPPRYAEPPQPAADSPFHAMFGLQASAAAPPADEAAASGKTLTEHLEDANDRATALLLARAKHAFKTATLSESPARAEEMSRAISALEAVREVRPAEYEPELLLVHAELFRGRIWSATMYLQKLVAKNPGFFTQHKDVREYFGDVKVLEDQARKFIRVGDENPDLVEAQALQAYCAWVLGDLPRVRLTIEALARQQSAKPEVQRALQIAFAINAGLN